MRKVKDVSGSPCGARGNLQICSVAAFLACLLMLIWAMVPVFTGAGSLDAGTLGRRLLMPIGFIILNVAGVVLTASIVATLFAQSNWRNRGMAVGPLLAGVLLFGVQAILMWRISLALDLVRRADPVFWFFAGVAVSFLSTWLLLEPLLRLPRDVSDAARLDGLGFAGLCRHVLLPRMKKRLLTASLLPFAASLAHLLPALAVGL